MSILPQLLSLAELDDKMRDLEALKTPSRVAHFQSRCDGLQARHSAAEQRLRQLDEETAAMEARLGRLDALLADQRKKLYAGAITNSKELASLQAEISGGASQRDALESAILEAMESQESESKKLAAVAPDLEEARADLLDAQNDEKERREALQKREAEIRQARLLASAGVPAPVLDQYKRLRSALGSAIARVKGGTCLGCRMDVPSSHWRGVKQGQLLNCPSCGRFLEP